MYRAGPIIDRSSLIQQAAAALMVAKLDWATQIKKQAASPMVDLQRGTKRLVLGFIIAFVGMLAYLLLR